MYHFAVRLWEKDKINVPVINQKITKIAICSLKVESGRVEEPSNLIFHLKLVSKVPSQRNREVCAKKTVLPQVTPHLDARWPRPIPKNKLKELKKHISSHIENENHTF